MLQKRQLQILGKILRCPETHPIQKISFARGGCTPLMDAYARRKGRPNKEWVPKAIKLACQTIEVWRNWSPLRLPKLRGTT